MRVEHQIPVDDPLHHECSKDCVCRPSLTAYADIDGVVWVYQHYPLDGRPPEPLFWDEADLWEDDEDDDDGGSEVLL